MIGVCEEFQATSGLGCQCVKYVFREIADRVLAKVCRYDSDAQATGRIGELFQLV